jgi:sugar O-acyltransferase (sialic acid O-acetyltransferase NeuD family)
MKSNDILLIGSGGHALSCIDVIEQESRYRIAGLIGSAKEVGKEYFGYRVIAQDEELPSLLKFYKFALVAIGGIQSQEPRMQLFQQAIQLGFEMPTVISPTAYISPHASIGIGSIVLHGAVINAGSTIGKNCIINNQALIDHGVTIGDHSHISTGSILNGDVSIGFRTFIGSGSVVKQGLTIGDDCLVGMGLSVRHSLSSSTSCKEEK